MSISFKCSTCAKAYTVKNELAGKRAQCKQCGQPMKIPALPPASEPDLRADSHAGGQVANAETVAGSLIHNAETVAGRGASAAGRSSAGHSVAGRSTAGHSAAGRSTSGRSAPREEPQADYGQPQLSALKQVAVSEMDAFEVKGGTGQSLRGVRGPAAKNYAPGEPWSFLLTVAMAGATAFYAYSTLGHLQGPAGVSPDAVQQTAKPVVPFALSAASLFAITLAVAAPLVMAAWYGACKIINVRLPSNLYLRAAGLAALPTILLAISWSVPAMKDNATLIALAAVPLGYVMLQFVHAQKPAIAGITAGLGTVGAAIGLVIAANVAMASIEDPAKASFDTKVQNTALAIKTAHDNASNSAGPKNTAPVDTGPKVDPKADQAVKDAQVAIDGLKLNLEAHKNQTKEAFEKQATAAEALIATGKQTAPDRPEWAAMSSDLATARTAAAGFPSATPTADITQAAPPGADWTSKPGRKDISAFAFNLAPPIDGRLELDYVPGEKMHWEIGEPRTNLTIEQVTSSNPQQQRPWIAPAYVLADAKDGVFAIAAESDAAVEYGTINGMPAAKLTIPDPSNSSRSTTIYALHKGATWLKCTIGPVASGDTTLNAAQQSVRSLHERAAGEPTADPLPASDLVSRLQNNAGDSDRIIGLLKGKPNAEDAVHAAVGFSPDDATLQRFAPALIAVGTEKSAPMLWKIAACGTPVGDQARESLRTLEPKAATDLSFALLDVKSGSIAQVKKGLDVLAYMDLDKAHQSAVSKTLSAGLDNHSLNIGNNGATLEATISKWMDVDLAHKMQAMLDPSITATATIPSTKEDRKLAMHVLGATNDRKYVQSIINRITDDTPTVSETLINMGVAAEPEIDRLIVSREMMMVPASVKATLAILNEIGTQRSVSALQTLMTRSGDPEIRDTAKALVAKIKEAAKTAPPAPAAGGVQPK